MSEGRYYKGKVLVVGNDHYEQVKPDLDNAVNDAVGIYNEFQSLGYMMMPPALDIDIDQFDKLFYDFKSDLDKFSVGIFYYSGHGIEIDGKNYLIMTKTPLTDNPQTTIRYSIDLQQCITELHDTGCKMIIVIIDACRDNPFEHKERGWGSVNLAPIFAPKGTLIAYSTSPGERASDFGMDGHSVYTGALLKHLKEEGLEIETFFKKVRSTVDAMSGGRKTSWEHTSLIGSFCFNTGKLIHVDDIDYMMWAIHDDEVENQLLQTLSIIKGLRSYNYYKQNDAIKALEGINPEAIDKNELFVIGRNLLQAAEGGAFDAQKFISDADVLSRYTIGQDNHLLNGILFEIYFNHKGQFRYKNFKSDFLQDIMKLNRLQIFASSFSFIENVLKEFQRYLLYVPSQETKKVDINIKVAKEVVSCPFNVENEMYVIKSISFEGNELIANDGEENTFPSFDMYEVNIDELKKMLCEGYVIPSDVINLIFNEDVKGEAMWFNVKLKRFFR